MNTQTPKTEVPELTQLESSIEEIECSLEEKAPKNPQDIVRVNALEVCISTIHDIRFVEMPDDAKDAMLKNLRKELCAICDSIKQSLEG